MTPDIQQILRLQSLDARAADLRKSIDALPRQMSEMEKKLEQFIRRLEADRQAILLNTRSRKSLEDDIQVHRAKVSKLRDQMAGAKNNEQYRAFQNEIDFCQVETRKAEDKILELMTAFEPLDAAVKGAEAILRDEKLKVEVEQERAKKRAAEDKSFLEAAMLERATLAASLEPKLIVLYERIRKKWNGVAVADGTAGRCSACHMSIRPQAFQDLKKRDRINNCESCGRILYYNPPVSLEHEIHQKV